MYIVAVYDIGEKRVGKILKIMRGYLHWVQNSVFEGEISEATLKELKIKLAEKIETDEDSILFFKLRDGSLINKEVMGLEKNPIDTFI
ncbi:MAG: CRISPR-associated endonuclease Cas2 [Calditrichaceae bacterium]|nr:CRISPR-associated endonuclease Cas2 [Calditrichaceae bacterium]RQV93927.1 MAG: CRISPR-associated endonuclease Cas2 [Calditrichota bacterium]